MRKVPVGLQAKLDSGVTTLCACWRIDPHNGPPLGFTEHDKDIAFDGVIFEASSGFSAGALERSLGLAIDNATASGALRSEQITDADISRGRFDGAEFSLWLVDWLAPADRMLTFRGEIGEITRGTMAFEAEIRGMTEYLNRSVGRRFLQVCDAELGDRRCGLNTDNAEFKADGAVTTAIDLRSFRASGLAGFDPDWFRGGTLSWNDGANADEIVNVRTHNRIHREVLLELDRDMISAPQSGQEFSIVAGCDKRNQTCRQKFSNIINFRGFPYTPGESWIGAYPTDGGLHDGGSRGGG
ncbi:MAG: DUF2163 domain-containing protein [Paracoccaceae bacterium]